MQKLFFVILAFLIINKASAQRAIEATNEFIIEGLIKKSIVVNIDSLKNYSTIKIDSVVITNHLGEKKSTLKNIAVIPLKNFLNKIEIETDRPKELSEFYFVFIASDGYKVVFSWNEIFNNKLGQEIYIIIERDGAKIENLDGRIAIFSRTDLMSGRRYVKGLKKIVVKRAE